MSLAEAQEMMTVLQEIMALLDKAYVKTTTLNNDLPRTKETVKTFRQLERLALRWLVIAKQLGLPPEFQKTVDFIAKVVVAIRMYQISINMLMATNPVTMAIGITGLIGTTIATVPSMLEGY